MSRTWKQSGGRGYGSRDVRETNRQTWEGGNTDIRTRTDCFNGGRGTYVRDSIRLGGGGGYHEHQQADRGGGLKMSGTGTG